MDFGTTALTGTLDVALDGTTPDLSVAPRAHLEIDMASLTSGNPLYDAELHRRVDVRLFPTTSLRLIEATGSFPDRLRVRAEVDFHGVTRELDGSVSMTVLGRDTLMVSGEHAVDIRDFDVPTPSVLMLRIFPDVRVHLQIEARAEQ